MHRSLNSFRGVLCASLALAPAAALAAPTVARIATPGGLTAATAAPGDELLIQGSDFGSARGEVWLDRGGYGREAEVLAWNTTDGTIRVRIPAAVDLGALRLIVRAGDEESAPYPLQVTAAVLPAAPTAGPPPRPLSPGAPAAPEIRAVNVLGGGPTTQGIAGTRVLISGARLGSRGELRFNGAPAAATTVWRSDYIVATLPNTPGAGPITVRRDPGLPDEAPGVGPSFTIVAAPVITGYTRGGSEAPGATDHASPGATIVLQGSDLGTGGQVTFLGSDVPVQSWSPQAIVVTVPWITGTGPLVVILNAHTGAEARAQGPALTVTMMN